MSTCEYSVNPTEPALVLGSDSRGRNSRVRRLTKCAFSRYQPRPVSSPPWHKPAHISQLHLLALPNSGWPTILKMTCWVCGTNPSTLERKRAPGPSNWLARIHPGGNPEANLKSISHRCHPILVACVWELTRETIHLPLGCLLGGEHSLRPSPHHPDPCGHQPSTQTRSLQFSIAQPDS